MSQGMQRTQFNLVYLVHENYDGTIDQTKTKDPQHFDNSLDNTIVEMEESSVRTKEHRRATIQTTDWLVAQRRATSSPETGY